MIGLSASTTLGDWSFNAEVAYRPDRPMFGDIINKGYVDANLTNMEEHDSTHASVHGIWLGGPLGPIDKPGGFGAAGT